MWRLGAVPFKYTVSQIGSVYSVQSVVKNIQYQRYLKLVLINCELSSV